MNEKLRIIKYKKHDFFEKMNVEPTCIVVHPVFLKDLEDFYGTVLIVKKPFYLYGLDVLTSLDLKETEFRIGI